MANIDSFLEDVTRDMRARLAVLDEPQERIEVEDGIALLTDYRLSGLDESVFQRLLTTLRRGRSPVRLLALRPQAMAAVLAWRWQTYIGDPGAPALD